MTKSFLLGFLAFFLFFSCSTEQQAPFTVAYKAAWDAKHPEWTPILVEAIKTHGDNLLGGKIDGTCGDRLAFFTMLFSAMSEQESGFNPSNRYVEKFPDSKGNRQVSGGLLQMSVDDAKIYGCDFKSESDLYDVKKNLECGVKAANALTKRDGLLTFGSTSKDAKGLARYWSVMRDGPNDGPKKQKIIAKANSVCLLQTVGK